MASYFCANESSPVFKHLENEIGYIPTYQIFNSNGNNLPESIEEADMFISQFKVAKQAEANLKSNIGLATIEQKFDEGSAKVKKFKNEYTLTRNEKAKVVRVSNLIDELRALQGKKKRTYANNFSAKKGTVLHSYMQKINDKVLKGEPVYYARTVKEVIDELRLHDEFEQDSKEFMSIKEAQFSSLVLASKELKKSLDVIQNSIDPKGTYSIFTEITLYDESREDNGLVGTPDLVVVFSDQSGALYDYKSKSFGGKTDFSAESKQEFLVQLQNYQNMLKKYGLINFRQSRVIPVNVDFSKKDEVTGDYVNQIADGFQQLQIFNSQTNIEWLKPKPFNEFTDNEDVNVLITKLQARVATLQTKLGSVSTQRERVDIYRKINRLNRTIENLVLNKDIGTIFENVSKIIGAYNSKIGKTQYEGGFTTGELIDAYQEISIYDELIDSFTNELKKLKESDKNKYEQLRGKLNSINVNVKGVEKDLLKAIIDRVGGPSILSGGQGLSGLEKRFSGLDEINIPIYQKLLEYTSQAEDLARIQSEKDMRIINKADVELQSWAKSNGISNPFTALYNKETGQMYDKYSDEFWNKVSELKAKIRAKEAFNAADMKWVDANFEIDQEAVTKEQTESAKFAAEDLERGDITKEEYDQFIANFDTIINPNKGTNFYKLDRRFVKPKKENTKYYSKQYQFILNHQPLLNYYNMHNEYMHKARVMFGEEFIGRNFVANIHKGFTEALLENGILSIRGQLDALYQKHLIREHDEILGMRDGVTGEYIEAIPMLYLQDIYSPLTNAETTEVKLEAEALVAKHPEKNYSDEVHKLTKIKEREKGLDSKSSNLTRNLMLFTQTLNSYQHLKEIEASVQGLKLLVQTENMRGRLFTMDGKAVWDKTRDEVAESFGLNAEEIETFNTFVERLVYQKKIKQDFAVGKDKKFSGNKMIRTAMNYFSASAVGLHIPLMMANYVSSVNNLNMFAREGRMFTKKGMDKALNMFGKRDPKVEDIFDFLQPTNKDKLREEADESGGFVSKWFRTKTLYLGFNLGDDRLDAALATAMADHYILDSDGKIKNPKTDVILNDDAKTLLELVERRDDGSTKIPGLSSAEYTKFRLKVINVSNAAKGTLSEHQKGVIYSTMTGIQVLFLRSWMPGMATARFGKLEYDMTLEMFNEGRYRVGFGELFGNGMNGTLTTALSMLKDTVLFRNYTGNLNEATIDRKMNDFLNRFPEVRMQLEQKYGNLDVQPKEKIRELFMDMHQAKMNALLHELRMYLVLTVALSALSSLDWEDREDDSLANVFTYNTHEVARRALLELSFWLSPTSAGEIIRSPIALYNLLTNFAKIMENDVIVELSYLVKGERDSNKRTYPFYYFLKSLPVLNRLNFFFEIFEPYRRPTTLLDKIVGKPEDE